MKLFYSYSHLNSQYRDEMEKHLMILKKDGKLTDWSDKKIEAGGNLNNEIDKNLCNSDIICLLISSDFIASQACMKELEVSIKRQDEDGVSVIPIILSHCAWKDTELIKLKAIPKDGRPVSTFKDSDEAWFSVYEEIKIVIEKRTRPALKSDFKDYLEDTELSSILGKDNISLSDIYIPLDLRRMDFNDKASDITFDKFFNEYVSSLGNIVISGDQQVGKTALLRQIFLRLPSNFIPVFIDCTINLSGKINNIINNHFSKQYSTNNDAFYYSSTKILLFDDFHKLKTDERRRIIDELKDKQGVKVIITVDDIYNLGIKEQMLTKIFKHYQIKNMGESLRDDLTCKWMTIIGKNPEDDTLYRDQLNSRINAIIQKTVVPANPFFIYTIIASHEIVSPLESEITSQGHCYQALIYFALRKVGASNVQIDMYTNVLSELAIYLNKQGVQGLSEDRLSTFFDEYLGQFTTGIKKEAIVSNLIKANILKCSSIKEISFKYKYQYLYFLGKYFSEHLEENKTIIEAIIDNLQIEENGYILIFLIHHTKNPKVLEHIELNLLFLFDKQKEITLVDSEIDHLNKYSETLKPLVIDKVTDVEKNRKDALTKKDKHEEEAIEGNSAAEDAFMANLRRAIKTVEVAGHILRNRSGSLKTNEQKVFLESSMNVFLRIADFFLGQFQKHEMEYVDYLSYLVSKKLENKEGVVTEDKTKIKEMAEKIFFNMNLMTCFATVMRISHSLCSKELISIMKDVCDKKSSPISYLIKKQCEMMYKGQIDINDLTEHQVKMSILVKRLLSNMVIDHCYMHKIEYKDRQKISHVLGIKEKDFPIGAEENKP